MPTLFQHIPFSRIRSAFVGLALLLTGAVATAQPVFAERYDVDNVQFFPDQKDLSLHYYLPIIISPAKRTDGSPDFFFLRTVSHSGMEMTTNGILQFTLQRERVDNKVLLQNAKSRNPQVVEIKPLPISSFRMKLTDGRQRIGTLGVPAGDLSSGRNVELGHWREQTFNVALTQEAATLLSRQKDSTGSISFYLSYEIRADFIPARKPLINVTGTGELISLDSIPIPAPVLTNRVARSGAVKLSADVGLWGEKCYREIVVNYISVPRYLPFSVGCADFSDGLRPDLEAKIIKVCGTGVTGQEVCRDIEFSAEMPALEAVTVKFPGPVLSDRPLRYKVIEISLSGEEKVTSWQPANAGQHIDITTPLAERFLAHQEIELYAEPEDLATAGYTAAALLIEYKLLGEPHRLEIEITENDDDPFRTADFHYDKSNPPTRRVWYVLPDGSKQAEEVAPLTDSFINLNPKQ